MTLAEPAPPRFSYESVPPRTADLASRAGAFLLDGLVLLGVLLAAAVLLVLGPEAGSGGVPIAAGRTTLLLLLALPTILAYFTILEAFAGGTFGKLAIGLRVESISGERAGLFDCFVRNLLRLLWVPALLHALLLGLGLFLLDPLALLGYVAIAADVWLIRTSELDQRMGDLAADTVIVAYRRSADAS